MGLGDFTQPLCQSRPVPLLRVEECIDQGTKGWQPGHSHTSQDTLAHPVLSTPPERTRNIFARHFLRQSLTQNHWHAEVPTQNFLAGPEPVHTGPGFRNV